MADEKILNEEETTSSKEAKKSKKADKKADAFQAEKEKLEKELADTKDSYMRVLAEYDNFRKRTQKEKESAYNDSKASTLALLLPVIDNFDRAIDNKTDDVEAYRKGIEMTYNQLKDILNKADVVAFGEIGEEFNPEIHNAVMTTENPDLPENSIAAVFEKGYKMGDRVLRFASVQITQ
ncbi:MAG: nucleotide exchange factor GrpE [Clostridia bacterium]|nr:nucleotide exchange factor GrpE [Clostridia bacterium]